MMRGSVARNWKGCKSWGWMDVLIDLGVNSCLSLLCFSDSATSVVPLDSLCSSEVVAWRSWLVWLSRLKQAARQEMPDTIAEMWKTQRLDGLVIVGQRVSAGLPSK